MARDPDRLVYTVPEAGRLLGLGRNAAYAAAASGQIPNLRIGRLLLVPKIPFHRMLGIAPAVTTEAVMPIDLSGEPPKVEGAAAPPDLIARPDFKGGSTK